MRIEFRRISKGEIDWELLWASVLGSTGLLAGMWIYWNLPRPVCFLKKTTGVPCPTCGMTRSIQNILSGNLGEAAAWNPLVFGGIFFFLLYGVYAAIVVTLRLPRLRIREIRRSEAFALRSGAVVLIALNWVYLVWYFHWGAGAR